MIDKPRTSLRWECSGELCRVFEGDRAIGSLRVAGPAAEVHFGSERWIFHSHSPGIVAVVEAPGGRTIAQGTPRRSRGEETAAIQMTSGESFRYERRLQDSPPGAFVTDEEGRIVLGLQEDPAGQGHVSLTDPLPASPQKTGLLVLLSLYLLRNPMLVQT